MVNTGKTDQSGYYAFAVITLAKFIKGIRPVIGSGADALMGRTLAKILAGSSRFERTGHISLKEACREMEEIFKELVCFGKPEILECNEKDEKVVIKLSDFILRYKEYGKKINEMDSTAICIGLTESFFRDATGDRKYKAHLDDFDEENLTIRVDKSIR